ncbi:MAG: ABC transporter permease [Lachnospiraceae bacterium]|nr:ABC transporter permease [Lachnospiraceae bacterium]
MKTVYLRELKLNLKSLIIWSLTVGGLGLSCILMYTSMNSDMKDMADMFSNMGAFSDAFGMSTLSIASLEGFFATEVGVVHGLGSGMFAALCTIGIISKEEERHSGEFLLSLPISRIRVAAAKGLCVLTMLVVFTAVCAVLYVTGFMILNEEISYAEFADFMIKQFLMNLEISAICFLISALSDRIKTGAGLGLAMIFYVYDLIGRVVPDLKDYLFFGPYSYCNASEIFSGEDPCISGIVVSAIVTVACIAAAFIGYNRRDLKS